MAGASNIEWTDASWNPIVGCSVVSPGCTNCYAMKDAWRKHHNPKLPHYRGLTKSVNGNAVWRGTTRAAPEHILTAPLHWRTPRRIFVNSMGDLFHESIPDSKIDQVFAVMALCPQHTFQVLTKRSERMRDYISARANDDRLRLPIIGCMNMMGSGATKPIGYRMWPLPNVWLGVSAERQQEADERIPHLLQTPAAVRFVSAEPLLGPISLRWSSWTNWDRTVVNHLDGLRALDWIIVGGESGAGARPMHPQWARTIRDECREARVPFFFKQWGEYGECEKRGNLYAVDHHRRNLMLHADGRHHVYCSNWDERDGAVLMRKLGKGSAGRLLDGRTWDEFPSTPETNKRSAA